MGEAAVAGQGVAGVARKSPRNLPVVAAALFFGAVVVACGIGPWIWTSSPSMQRLELGASPPSWVHPFGTDLLGRDQLARVMEGGRVSLAVGACAGVVALVIGVVYGSVAGYCGGRVDAAMMRVVDGLYAMPFALVVILLMVVFGQSLVLLFLAIGALEWLTTARIVRGQVVALRGMDFVRASRVLGATPFRILARDVVPNLLGPVLAYTALNIPAIILLESFLSFLGLGAQPPLSSWGTLIKEGAEVMEVYPWLLVWPAVVFSGTLLSINVFGEYLRDRVDPRRTGGRL